METRFEWQYKSANPLAAAEYKDFNVSELLAQVLVNRGVSAREYSKISYHFNDLRTEYLESIVDLEKACDFFIEKTDKLKKREIETNLELIYDTLEMTEDDILVPFSTAGVEGKFTVWDMIDMMRAGFEFQDE